MKSVIPLFLLMLAAPINAADTELKKISLPHPPNGDILLLPERKQLLVSGYSQFSRWLSQVNLTDYSSRLLPVPETAQFFSKALLAGESQSQLIFLGLKGISRLSEDASHAQLLVASESIYRVLDKNRLRSADFVVELGSGLSDFLVSDFQQTHLYRQQQDGSFKHYALQIPALVQSWRDSPDYTPRKHYIVDVNQDSRSDLVFVSQGKFQLFLQQPDGSFSTEPLQMSWPVSLSTEEEADQRNDAGRSYNGQNIDTLRDITDIDGDGIPDLVINREQLADALERNNSFRIHFGVKSETGLIFNAEPDTFITTETSPIDVVIDDINNDGRKDFYIPSTDFGLGTIIRVLLRGSANLDIDFYLLNAQRQYPEKADFRQQATIDVSISNFRYDMPLFLVADTQGSGQKSLLVGDGGDELRIYQHEDKRLFSRRSERIKLNLPRDARKARLFDLTGNGKDDLVLPFDSLEDEQQRNQLLLLLNP
ncbi:VCBS repeat-containing protein [Rheinheimera baltica]|uniref:FG-GAP repeat domain-containing protein n=1 Tax=Rheinheimera baltica TaxID=67576 RepID=UPI00273F7708|nr:VCBS repeat-containing protein [Rheinheimera baltica]MDP5141661.1 VCBS repeat-containing protein [Rheinheimera baltica]